MSLAILVSIISFAAVIEARTEFRNVDCQPKPTVIATNSPKFAHYPYYVTLHRCSGSWGRTNPAIMECVASETKEVKIPTFRLGDFTAGQELISLVNHTKCTAECVVKANQCSKYETYDKANCLCRCPHNQAPVQCPAGMMWDPHRCQCACASRPGTCPTGMAWSDASCSCACPAKLKRRCLRKGKVVDSRTCSCVKKAAIQHGGSLQSAQNKAEHSGPSFWIYVVVGEFFAMLCVCDAILYRKKSGLFYSITSSRCHTTKYEISKPEIVVVNSSENPITNSCRSSNASLNSGAQETRALISLTPTQSVEHL